MRWLKLVLVLLLSDLLELVLMLVTGSGQQCVCDIHGQA